MRLGEVEASLAELTAQGHRISTSSVGSLLRKAGFSLQSNAKVMEGARHPDRDVQFRYINEQVKDQRRPSAVTPCHTPP